MQNLAAAALPDFSRLTRIFFNLLPTLFWRLYNTCNYKKMAASLSKDFDKCIPPKWSIEVKNL